jgi:hypothetical protein
MHALLDSWKHDASRAAARPYRPLDASASVRLAVRLIEQGCLSKAMTYLSSRGLGDLGLPEIAAQLKAKHPQERQPWEVDLRDAPRVELGSARDVLKSLKRRAGTGPDNSRNEYLLRIVRGVVSPVVREKALGAWATFADHVANGDFPDWFYLVWTSVTQFAPIKEEGDSPRTHDVRPVGCGTCERRAVAAMVKTVAKEPLREYCEPVQLGQGTRAGTQALGISMRTHIELYFRHIIVKWDFINAYNKMQRRAIIEAFQRDPRLHFLLRYFQSELAPESLVFARTERGQVKVLDYRSVEGGQQGAFSAGAAFNALTRGLFGELDDAIAQGGGFARAVADDLVITGPPDVVWPALAADQRIQ